MIHLMFKYQKLPKQRQFPTTDKIRLKLLFNTGYPLEMLKFFLWWPLPFMAWTLKMGDANMVVT